MRAKFSKDLLYYMFFDISFLLLGIGESPEYKKLVALVPRLRVGREFWV